MHPRRSFQLVRWLAGWLRRGAVPVATLNLQRGVPPQQTVPDAWHHQMAFGVGPQVSRGRPEAGDNGKCAADPFTQMYRVPRSGSDPVTPVWLSVVFHPRA